ncbi:MAG TPA: GldG family protein [Opitutaceae bacterium]|jgi:ABC-type uncharacterized transport system involved in gliding motility auxiliary subunit
MKTGQKTLYVALLFVALVLLNYLAYHLPLRADVTKDRIYTLSAGSKNILAKIEEPITLDFYFSRTSDTLPIEFKDYADRVEEMLRQYVRASHGKVTLHVIDPEPDTPEEEQATKNGIDPQRIRAGADPYYFGVVATQADKVNAIGSLTSDREQFLEYDLSELIYKVQQIDKKKLGLITSLPLQGSQGNPMMQQQGTDPQYVINEWSDTFDIVPVDAAATELPANLDVLAVVQPENLSPRLQFAIDQFLLAGKPVFMAVDPSSVWFKQQGGQEAMMGGPQPNVTSDLPTLFRGWGVAFDPQKIVADNEMALAAGGENGAETRHADWLTFTPEDFNPSAPPTAQLNSMWMFDSGSLSLKPGTDLAFTPLVQTTAEAGELDAAALQFAQPDDIARKIVPSGKKTVAALIAGHFHTAFPAGSPKDEADKSSAKAPAPFLKASSKPSTLLLVADSDWLLDAFSIRKINVLGTAAAEPYNDNLSFAANSLDFLAGSEDLISIRTKGSAMRPFDVVRKMQSTANDKYERQLGALETQLNDLQTKLSALQNQKTEGNRLVATPEIAKAISDYQAQQASLRSQRRSIRLELRRGIDQLEYRLIAFNILFSPILLCAFGVWYQRRRK